MSTILKVLVALLLVVLVAMVVCAEWQRHLGQVTIPCSRMYLNGSLVLAPVNRWLAAVTQGQGDPRSPFLDMATHFPAHTRFKAQWRALHAEYLASRSGRSIRARDRHMFRTIADDNWRQVNIKWYGPISPETRAAFPVTTRLVESDPRIHLAMFSIMQPGAHIAPHIGPQKGCVRYHLCLGAPEGGEGAAYLVVDGSRYVYRAGEEVLWDDTFLHEVHNESATVERVILFLDVERAVRGATRQALVRRFVKLLGPLGDF